MEKIASLTRNRFSVLPSLALPTIYIVCLFCLSASHVSGSGSSADSSSVILTSLPFCNASNPTESCFSKKFELKVTGKLWDIIVSSDAFDRVYSDNIKTFLKSDILGNILRFPGATTIISTYTITVDVVEVSGSGTNGIVAAVTINAAVSTTGDANLVAAMETGITSLVLNALAPKTAPSFTNTETYYSSALTSEGDTSAPDPVIGVYIWETPTSATKVDSPRANCGDNECRAALGILGAVIITMIASIVLFVVTPCCQDYDRLPVGGKEGDKTLGELALERDDETELGETIGGTTAAETQEEEKPPVARYEEEEQEQAEGEGASNSYQQEGTYGTYEESTYYEEEQS